MVLCFSSKRKKKEKRSSPVFLSHSLSFSKNKKYFFSRESYSWRNTLTSESAAWRTFVKEEIHAMGLAL